MCLVVESPSIILRSLAFWRSLRVLDGQQSVRTGTFYCPAAELSRCQFCGGSIQRCSQLDNWRIHIHIFVFTDRKNNRFLKKINNTEYQIMNMDPLNYRSFYALYEHLPRISVYWMIGPFFSCLGLATPLGE